MMLLSEHVHSTLQVLYIKGLERVSDVGVKAIYRCCSKLEVLDVVSICTPPLITLGKR
jgi:hypothetical protein